MSRRHGHRHRVHGNPFSVRGDIECPDWSSVFGRSAPFAVDIGFGRGQFVLELAQKHPDWNVVGIEIRNHLVERLLEDAEHLGLANVHAVVANANEHFAALFPPGSVEFVSVNFPDPWFKKRHHKRRVVQPDLLDVIAGTMRSNATFHAKSDYEPVATEMFDLLSAHPGFINLEASGGFALKSTTGIATEREAHHEARGQTIFHMHFRRADVSVAPPQGLENTSE